jgi:hypothetical protein
MALSDSRIRAQAAFVARRLLAEGLVKTASPAELRRGLEAVLAFDRDRERALEGPAREERLGDPGPGRRLRRDVPQGEADAGREEEDPAVKEATREAT